MRVRQGQLAAAHRRNAVSETLSRLTPLALLNFRQCAALSRTMNKIISIDLRKGNRTRNDFDPPKTDDGKSIACQMPASRNYLLDI